MRKKKILPETVKSDILKILEKRLEIYKSGPYIYDYSVKIVEQDCSNSACPDKHNTIEVYVSYLLGEEILDICKYTKKHDFGLLYKENLFTIVMD